jgi:exodeoxyribonuclease VII small subunit
VNSNSVSPGPSPSAPANDSAPAAEPSPELGFDQVLDRLRQVVLRLEQGSLSLEQALLAFEDGVKLSRRGSAILDAAEQRVELLIQQDDGSERRAPFPPGPGQGPSGTSPGT